MLSPTSLGPGAAVVSRALQAASNYSPIDQYFISRVHARSWRTCLSDSYGQVITAILLSSRLEEGIFLKAAITWYSS